VDTKEVEVAMTTLFLKNGTIPAIEVVVVPKVEEPVPKKLASVNLLGQKTGGIENHSGSGLKAVMKIQYIGNKKTIKINTATIYLTR
jgi:hypothetical protein